MASVEQAAAGGPKGEITQSPVTAAAIGVAAGLVSVFFGVGGGLVMVPALAYFLRVRQHRAVGTSLAVILPTAAIGVLKYLQNPRLQAYWDWWVVAQLALGGVVGAVLGAVLASALGARHLRRAFGVVVMAAGGFMIYQAWRHGGGGSLAAVEYYSFHWGWMMLAGIGVGMVSGLLGVGGGVLTVPALTLLLAYPQKLAQGISLAVIIPVALSGAVAHQRKGNIIWTLALWLAVGAMLSAQVAGAWVQQVEDPVLRALFGLLMVAVGATMVINRRRAGEMEGAIG